MCEPFHSIVQYKGGLTGRLAMFLGKVEPVQSPKEIGGFFHLSKMGKGHSEAIAASGKRESFIAPADPMQYEAGWWNRSFHEDHFTFSCSMCGSWNYCECDKSRPFNSARRYANAVSIGHIKTCRRFLEVSLQHTERPRIYHRQFIVGMLSPKGREAFKYKMFQKLEGPQQIKYLLGFTRKRNLLMPKWADDSSLWN